MRRSPTLPAVFLLSGLPLVLAGTLLLTPAVMLSERDVMDLLFLLAGAWQGEFGRVQHVDFHEAVGPLNFLLTRAGFHLAGVTPFAFLAGQMLAVAGLFLAATTTAARRLPLAPSVVFVLSVCLAAMMPANTGGQPDVFTFAMSYNRYGWAAISILCLILFAEPRRSPPGHWIDVAWGLLLLLAMFYVKITYFLVGVGALVLALSVCDHVRVRWRRWALVGLLVTANAVAPHSHGYLADLWWAVLSGLPNTGARRLVVEGILGNGAELAVYGASLLAAAWLWRRNLAPVALPLAILFLIAAALMLFAQNTQLRGLPLGAVALFLVYGAVLPHRRLAEPPVLAALLLAPALAALTAASTFVLYYHAATSSPDLLVARQTNARGLAVRPATVVNLRPEALYVTSLLEAAALFADGRRKPGRIQLIGPVNPLPFMLGFAPPRGGDLFWEATAPPRPVQDVLGDADYVLVPTRIPDHSGMIGALHERFGPYLRQFFPRREETAYWIVYSRAPGAG